MLETSFNALRNLEFDTEQFGSLGVYVDSSSS